MNNPIIVIDGPAGAGKSSTARAVAKKLGLPVLDTGSLYRAVAWMALQQGLDVTDEAAVADLLEANPPTISGPGTVEVMGQNLKDELRTPDVTAGSSKVAALPRVRDLLIAPQREYAKQRGCVAEGRDMGTVMFPDALLKIYLTANDTARQARTTKSIGAKAAQFNAERDKREMTRTIAPLKPADDAVLLDNSNIDLDGVVEKIVKLAQERLN